MEWKKVAFMAQNVGDEFGRLIISLIKFGSSWSLRTCLWKASWRSPRWEMTSTSIANASVPFVASTPPRLPTWGEAALRVRFGPHRPVGEQAEFSVAANS